MGKPHQPPLKSEKHYIIPLNPRERNAIHFIITLSFFLSALQLLIDLSFKMHPVNSLGLLPNNKLNRSIETSQFIQANSYQKLSKRLEAEYDLQKLVQLS